MARSLLSTVALTILLAFSVLPDGVEAQERRTHTVAAGETLWVIAQEYFDDGRQWTRIYEANRDVIPNPDVVEVGTVLVIPGAPTATVGGVVVVPPAGAPPADPPPRRVVEGVADPTSDVIESMPQVVARGPRPVEYRTVFWRDTTQTTVLAEERPPLAAISSDQLYQAPWLHTGPGEPAGVGTFEGYDGAPGRISPSRSALGSETVRLNVRPGAVSVGALVQLFRVTRTIEGVGDVVEPTGIVRVTSVEASGVTGVVEKLYEAMRIGDLVRPLPSYSMQPGRTAAPVTSDQAGRILGFAKARAIYGLNDHVFVDLGSRDGVRVGDEFVVMHSSGEGWSGTAQGRLQVLRTGEGYATTRIVAIDAPVFDRGVPVRLAARMR